MADDSTRIIIGIDLILRNLEKTLAGLSAVEKQIQTLANVKLTSANLDKATVASQRLTLQQQKLAVQAQELANRQEKASQTADKLALSQLRLEQAFARTAQAEKRAADTSLNQAQKNAAEVQRIQAQTAKQAEQQQKVREQAARTLADVESREAQRGARELEKSLQQSQKNTAALAANLEKTGNSLRSIGQGLTSLGFALSVALTAPLVALGKAGLDAAVTLDSLRLGLKAITGSASEAERQLARLTQIAKLPGIGFQEAIQGSIRLQAVGFSAKDAEKALREFSNAIALTGGGRDELARVTIQLGQLAAKGKVLSQDLRPIIEAAPAVGTALKQAFGTVNADDIAALTGSSEEFFNILVKQLEQLPRAAGGAKNAFENFKDSVFRASASIGEALIPVLTKLIDFALPIIEKLAEGFRALPKPLQSTIVVLGAVVAALGPVLIVSGQLIVALGRLAVGFAQMSKTAAGATTSIQGLAVAEGEAAVGARVLGIGLRSLGGPLVLIGTLIAGLVADWLLFGDSQKEVVKISDEVLAKQEEQVQSIKSQIQFLDSLKSGVARTADEEDKLKEIYNQLNLQAQTRVTGITDEEEHLAGLRKELVNLLNLRNQERIQQSANLASSLASTAQQIQANEAEIGSITRRVQANAELAAVIQAQGRITNEQSVQLARQSINASNAEEAVAGLRAESENLVDIQKTLRESTDGLNGTAKEQGRTLAILEQQTGLTARELLVAAKNMGLFRGDIEQTITQLELYTKATEDAAGATTTLQRELLRQSNELIAAGGRLKDIEQRNKSLVESAARLANANAKNFSDALKFMKAFIAAQPELARAIEDERKKAGQSFDEFIREALVGKDKSGTALRSAQLELEKALGDITKAEQAEQARQQIEFNERLLRVNETSFRLQLISYREYLETRAQLTKENLQFEIDAQQVAVDEATKTAERLQKAAESRGLPIVETTKRRADAVEAQARAIREQTKLNELRGKQAQIDGQVAADVAEATKQQEDDIRKLRVEYQQLQGNIENALKAELAEKFEKKLIDLAKEQKLINERLTSQTANLTTEERHLLEVKQEQNREDADLIRRRISAGDALIVLQVAEDHITEAKRKQKDLEDDLSFQVAFRGKQETEAIRQRLAGEDQLKQRLLVTRDIVQDEINRLRTLGQDVPRQLQKFVDQINLEVKGLGELSFSDQFRLVEQEFDRFNEKRISQIEDVERAVRHRDISELEGLILIKKANGEYVDELEAQVAVLEEIARKSNDPRLQQQAENARQTAADVRAATTEFASFGKQLRSISIDSLQRSLEDFFSSLTDRTKTAREKLLGLLEGFEQAIVNFVAKDFSRRIIESIFGTDEQQRQGVGGLIAKVKSLLGIGTQATAPDLGGGAHAADVLQPHGLGGAVGGAATEGAAGAALEAGATAAATALTTGGTTAATAFTTGVTAAATTITTAGTAFATAITTASAAITTAGAGFATAVAAAATGFASAVVAAGAAFATAVAASSAAQTVGSLGGGAASAFAATGDIISPQPRGRLVRVAEAGYPEAILTTDPRHAQRQASILREYLIQTKGLFGRVPVPEFAEGAFVTPRQAEMSMLSSLSGRPTVTPQAAAIANQTGGRQRNLRFVFVDDQRDVRNWVDSAEGDKVIVEKLTRNRPLIRRLAN